MLRRMEGSFRTYSTVSSHSAKYEAKTTPKENYFYILLVFPTTAQSLVFALLHVSASNFTHHQGVIYYSNLTMTTMDGRNM